jgi:hypothetical protein
MTMQATATEIQALVELAALDAQADALSAETYRNRRAAKRRRASRALLDRYEQLVETSRHPAIVAIENGVCSGCHVRLPTMVAYRARHTAAIHICPHCRRMLYAPEMLEPRRPTEVDAEHHAPRR